MDGVVSSNGARGSAGGGIAVVAEALWGVGVVQANGGNGRPRGYRSRVCGGGGGGGRIALDLSDDDGSAFRGRLEALGGDALVGAVATWVGLKLRRHTGVPRV